MSPLPGLIHLLRVTDAACVQPLAEPPWYATLTIHTYIPDNGRDAFGCSSMSVCTLTKQIPDSPVYATGVTARSRPRPRSSRPDKLKVVMAFNRPVYFFNLISKPSRGNNSTCPPPSEHGALSPKRRWGKRAMLAPDHGLVRRRAMHTYACMLSCSLSDASPRI